MSEHEKTAATLRQASAALHRDAQPLSDADNKFCHAAGDLLERVATIAGWGDYVGPGPVNDVVQASLAFASAYIEATA